MAYATGTATTANDLLAALATFAAAQGWTVDKNTTGLLFLHKGICYVQMQSQTTTYSDWTTGASVTTNDTLIRLSLATGVTTALTTYFGHPGSLCTTATDTDRCEVNQLQGPFPEYHIFSGGAGAPDYIMMAVRIGTDNWRHFGFGFLDKGTFTHSGVVFLCGQNGYFARQNGTVTQQSFNTPASARIPYAFNVGASSLGGGSDVQIYSPDAYPNTADWPAMISTAGANSAINLNEKPDTGYPNGTTSANPRILNPVMRAEASAFGGNVLLMPIPFVRIASTISKCCYAGDFPNIRLLNMTGFQNGQEITLGSDVWKIFSVGRFMPWATQTEMGFNYSTGPIAFAYKKVT